MSTPAIIDDLRGRYALSPTEAAHALGICRASVYNLIARGELRAAKIGRSTRISVSEIRRLAGDTPDEAA